MMNGADVMEKETIKKARGKYQEKDKKKKQKITPQSKIIGP